MNKIDLYQGDCLEVMKTLEENSVDAIITDPPYELGFMGKKWDNTGVAYNVDVWRECLRVLKPGGYLLSFGGTRTYHRMAVAIEDAGFEVRDMIEWVYGSGFPKSHNIGKVVGKLQGNKRKNLGIVKGFGSNNTKSMNNGVIKSSEFKHEYELTKSTSEWEGWGTALKPAHEPVCMARKPLAEKTVVKNVLKYGTGGINIDESRVECDWQKERGETWLNSGTNKEDYKGRKAQTPSEHKNTCADRVSNLGRFPANLIHDNSEEVRDCFPDSKSTQRKNPSDTISKPTIDFGGGWKSTDNEYSDSGNASRFFKSIIYQAKASKKDRGSGNNHPTVKPIKLIEYLINMVSAKGSVILDPFMGSGTTGVACQNTNRNFIGIELDEEYFKIAKNRIEESNNE